MSGKVLKTIVCLKPAFIVGFFVFAIFVPHHNAAAATTLSLVVTNGSSYELTAAQSPYVVNYLMVENGGSLTIDQGVILKLDHTSITIYGNLNINGSSDNPVYITSIKDDVGGDTNGDGSYSTPAAGDWMGIQFLEQQDWSTATINHAVIRYGGYSNCSGCKMSDVYINGGSVSINDSHISDSEWYGVRLDHGELSVDSCEVDHSQLGFNISQAYRYPTATIIDSNIHDNSTTGITATVGDLTLDDNVFTDNTIAVVLAASVNFTHENNSSSGSGLNGIRLSGTFGQDQEWNADLPYVIHGSFIIPSGITLTVGPGVIIKNEYQTYIVVNGTLTVNGTSTEPVYFTAITDDSVGGDTNSDGTTTQAYAGYWDGIGGGLYSSYSEINLHHAVVNFAGAYHWNQYNNFLSAIYVNNGSATIDDSRIINSAFSGVRQLAGTVDMENSEIANNAIGYRHNSGSFYASGSSFHGNSSSALVNYDSSDIDATGNWWGNASGPYNVTNNPSGTGDAVSNGVLIYPWLTADPFSS